MPRARTRVGVTRRQLLAGGLVAPLLPAPVLAAVARPRFRRRRKTPAPPVERQLFAAEAPPTQAAMQAFIERLWTRLAAAGEGRIPWRQYDLLAGLALRYGRAELLPLLAARLPPGSARAAKWLGDSRWRRRWSAAPSLTWSWPEGAGLTRRALPLTLPT
jgi:hypothetical protein